MAAYLLMTKCSATEDNMKFEKKLRISQLNEKCRWKSMLPKFVVKRLAWIWCFLWTPIKLLSNSDSELSLMGGSKMGAVSGTADQNSKSIRVEFNFIWV